MASLVTISVGLRIPRDVQGYYVGAVPIEGVGGGRCWCCECCDSASCSIWVHQDSEDVVLGGDLVTATCVVDIRRDFEPEDVLTIRLTGSVDFNLVRRYRPVKIRAVLMIS